MRRTALLPIILLSGCASPAGQYPSLQPRAAEAIDPRVPVTRPTNNRPVSASLARRLEALVGQAQSGNNEFEGPAAEAERLASSAGAPQSESWIGAEEALTAAIAARKLTATALSDIDELGATALQAQAGLAPNDLAAIKSAAATAGEIDKRQAERIHAIQLRLGL